VKRTIATLSLFVVSAGCARGPQPLPAQRQLLAPIRLDQVGPFVAMNHPYATLYFVNDISASLSAGQWRWTGKRPALRFRVPVRERLSFAADLAVPELTMRQTGPVTIKFAVNEIPLDTVRYDTPGAQHFQKPVPAAWLKLDGENIVSAEIDKLYHGEDHKDFGFILVRAGFVE
jgi:hypothetical protein